MLCKGDVARRYFPGLQPLHRGRKNTRGWRAVHLAVDAGRVS
jgi:hypothetical protein